MLQSLIMAGAGSVAATLRRLSVLLAAILTLVVGVGFLAAAALLALAPLVGMVVALTILGCVFVAVGLIVLLLAMVLRGSRPSRVAETPPSPASYPASAAASGKPDDLAFEVGRLLGANVNPFLTLGVAAALGFLTARRKSP